MNPFLLAFNLIIFILIVVISKKSTLLSIFILLLGIIGTLYIIHPQRNYWAANIAVHPKEIHDEIIDGLDQCHKHISLRLCRMLYNKATILPQHLVLLFITEFSQENILSFFSFPLKPLATVFLYIGLLYLYTTKISPLMKVMQWWGIFYGMFGLWGYRTDVSFSAIGFLLFTTALGFITTIHLIGYTKNHVFS